MTTIAYPSRELPGLPSVVVEVPEGWEPVHVPGTTLAARLPRDGEFAPNGVLTVEQCASDWTTERSLTEIRELAHSHGGDVSSPYAARLTGRDSVGCDATWSDADVDTILQANLFHIVEPPSGAVATHLVQLTGTAGGARAEADHAVIRDVLLTTRVVPSWESEERA